MRPEKIEFTNQIPLKALVRNVSQYPYHWHDFLEIIQVLKGTVNISIGDDNLILQEKDIAIINTGELHRITAGDPDNKILFIQIDPDFYRSILPDNRYLFIYCCSPYHEADIPEKYKEVKEYIARIVRMVNDSCQQEYKENLENLLREMLIYITYHFDFLRWGFGTMEFNEKPVERHKQIAEFTRNDQEANLGLKDMAAAIDISLQHLSNDIKKKFGSTFQELLYYGKCEEAAKLLLSTDKHIIDIAMECGFSDPKYLIKHFKHNFNCTPSAFRKKYRLPEEALAHEAQYRDYPLADVLQYLE